MNIGQLMTKDLKTCRQTELLDRAVKLMWEHDIGALPVVDDFGLLVGVVTDRDACVAAYMQRQPLHCLPVSVAMSKHVVTCTADDTDEAVARLMAKHKVRRIPVVDEDQRPIGIVSLDIRSYWRAVRRPVAGHSPLGIVRSTGNRPARRARISATAVRAVTPVASRRGVCSRSARPRARLALRPPRARGRDATLLPRTVCRQADPS
jgi:CBS domain-containing protein